MTVRAPDERRRASFRIGWEDSTKRGDVYSEPNLKRLTWNNLGYRFGQRFGDMSSDQINFAYDQLAILWERAWGVGSEREGVSRAVGGTVYSRVTKTRRRY